MEFQDKSLNCVDCGAEFIWTAGEQLFFADKNFKNEPKRCKSCKAKRAARPAPARRSGPRARRDHDQLLGVRQGNHRAVPADAGPPGVLPGMFPAAEVRGGRRRLARRVRRDPEGHAPAWPFVFWTRDLSLCLGFWRHQRIPRITPASSARLSEHPMTPSISIGRRHSLFAANRLQRRRALAARPRLRAPDQAEHLRAAGVKIVTLAPKPIDQTLRIHRDGAVPPIHDRPAGGRGTRDANLREVGRPRPRRHAARPDRSGQAAGRGAQHRGAARGHRGGRRVLARAGQAARGAAQGRRDQPAGIRRRRRTP